MADLTVRAAAAGDIRGARRPRTCPVASSARASCSAMWSSSETVTVRAVVPQAAIDLVRQRTTRVDVRLAERLDDVVPAVIRRAVPGGVRAAADDGAGHRRAAARSRSTRATGAASTAHRARVPGRSRAAGSGRASSMPERPRLRALRPRPRAAARPVVPGDSASCSSPGSMSSGTARLGLAHRRLSGAAGAAPGDARPLRDAADRRRSRDGARRTQGPGRRLVPLVAEHAARSATGCPTAPSARRAQALRPALRRDGFAPGSGGPRFALVREAAGRTLGSATTTCSSSGGRALLAGMVAEMETGEGKTLTATLPAASTAALAGIPVHVITVNDYLASRDAEWMGPVYQALGLQVGTVVHGMAAAGAAPGLRLRRDVLHQQGAGLRLPARPHRAAGGAPSRLQLRLERLGGRRGAGASGWCCAGCTSRSSTRPTAC